MDIQVNDIVQINGNCDITAYIGCLAYVHSLRSWGVQVYILTPEAKDSPPSFILSRFPFEEVNRIGPAPFVPDIYASIGGDN